LSLIFYLNMRLKILTLSLLSLSVCYSQFVEEIDDVGRVQRQLLQEYEDEDAAEVEDEIVESQVTTTTTTEEPWIPVDEKGPTRFYFENGKLPKFLMEIEKGIELTLYRNGMYMDTFVLESEAKGGISGTRLTNKIDDELDPEEKRIKKEDFELRLDYKDMMVRGRSGQHSLTGMLINFRFERKGNIWRMFELEFVNIGLNGEFHSLMMGPKTVSGDKVECPIGLSYSCADSGVFKSNMTLSMSGKVKFPGWRMQVFEVKRGKFGPMWECGELLSIGLWVGILVTLGFALICAWGFTMLASINTMDRFDDPKGKTIHIPQTTD